MVRHAYEDGPQRVTGRGEDAVVIISVEEFGAGAPEKRRAPFVEFMQGLHLGALNLTRKADHGPGVEL
ncbi:type II toxin-antitoxin system prevent-host-death family antitoxin [Aminobacter ciceronei]|uniref:type II toxin-antitoxin system prevent-host-death family antitoxin n=1 Tax=Aminobacter ciceronei TaxID=150723 RepID=UPI003F6F06B9